MYSSNSIQDGLIQYISDILVNDKKLKQSLHIHQKKKQQLGQFFTTNVDYILNGFEKYIKDKNIIDPFCGNCDLLNWSKNNGAKTIKGFDIDKSLIDNKTTFYNDSLVNPLDYDFVITNPPYLYINKTNDKVIFKNKHTDLYHLALESIMNSNEGIVIVPINFLSSENAKFIRIKFLEKFNIEYVKYFTQQVFKDTSYNVIAFYYKKKVKQNEKQEVIFDIQPQNETKIISLYKDFNWQIGGEFINEIEKNKNILEIKRLEESDLQNGNNKLECFYNHLNTKKIFYVNEKTKTLLEQNIMLLKAIDTGTEQSKICLEDIRKYGSCLVSLPTSRNQIYLIQNKMTIKEQEQIVILFNKLLNEKREKYFSLFMTNFRDNNRKRISFDFSYKLINYLYFKEVNKNARQHLLFGNI